MSNVAKRSKKDIGMAVRRVQRDGLVPLAELVTPGGPSEQALLRWVIQGKGGCYLDGVKDLELGWCSSPEALARFRAAGLATAQARPAA